MRNVRSVELYTGSREEKLPDFSPDFPYLASRAELDYYGTSFVPWHWHPGRGTVLYGMVNSNVLHKTDFRIQRERNVQLLHLFHPDLIGGTPGSRMDQRYVAPVVSASRPELIALYPENPEQAEILRLIRQAFQMGHRRSRSRGVHHGGAAGQNRSGFFAECDAVYESYTGICVSVCHAGRAANRGTDRTIGGVSAESVGR